MNATTMAIVAAALALAALVVVVALWARQNRDYDVLKGRLDANEVDWALLDTPETKHILFDLVQDERDRRRNEEAEEFLRTHRVGKGLSKTRRLPPQYVKPPIVWRVLRTKVRLADYEERSDAFTEKGLRFWTWMAFRTSDVKAEQFDRRWMWDGTPLIRKDHWDQAVAGTRPLGPDDLRVAAQAEGRRWAMKPKGAINMKVGL